MRMGEGCFAMVLDVLVYVVVSPINISFTERDYVNIKGFHLFDVKFELETVVISTDSIRIL